MSACRCRVAASDLVLGGKAAIQQRRDADRVPVIVVAARQIERYAARALESGVGIAGNTENIAALEQTISTATEILETARTIEEHTGTIEEVLAARAGRRAQ